MIFVGLFQVLTAEAYFYKDIKVVIQSLAGGFIGQRIRRNDLKVLKHLIKPSLQMFFGVVIMSLTTGFLIHFSAGMKLETALLSSIPGGVSDIALISEELGADPAQSTALQLVRYLIAILILPQVNSYICKRNAEKQDKLTSDKQHAVAEGAGKESNLFITIALSLFFGFLGKLSGIPAGAILGAIIAVSFFNIKTGKAYLPKWLKRCAQCVAGTLIGITINMKDIIGFQYLALPVTLVAINCIMINYVLGFLMYKTNDLDLPTCLFASVPAGLSDMVLVSLEQGGDPPKVAVLQLVRYLCVMTVMPSLIKLVIQLV